jgi:small basic protein
MIPLSVSPLDPLIPIVIMLVKQSGFPSRWNALIALACYAVWAAVSLWFGLRGIEGEITPELFVGAFVSAAVTGYVSYQLIYKGTVEDQITEATSIVKEPVSEEIDLEGEG